MKNCEYWQQQISRFLDGDLSPEEEAALWEHIAGCPDCARAFEDFSQQTSVLRAQVVRPPVDLSKLVMARIKNGQLDAVSFRKEDVKKPVSHRLRSWRKVALAACFVAVVAVGAVAGVYGRGARLAGGGDAGGTDAAAYLPEAQSDTIYVQLPENDAPAQAPQEQPAMPEEAARNAAPAPAETDPPVQAPQEQPATPEEAAEVPPAAVEPMPDESAVSGAAADAAPPAADPASAEDFALSAEAPEDGIMTIMGPAPVETAVPACQVLDGDGAAVGSIADEAALTALLTGDSWQGEAPAVLYTLSLDGTAYAFAADEDGALLWQRSGEAGFTRSPASLADLEALIAP